MPRAIRKSNRGCRSSTYLFWTDFRERSRWSAFHSSTPGLLDPVLNNDSLAVDTNQVLAAWRLVDPRRSAMRTHHRCHNSLARRWQFRTTVPRPLVHRSGNTRFEASLSSDDGFINSLITAQDWGILSVDSLPRRRRGRAGNRSRNPGGLGVCDRGTPSRSRANSEGRAASIGPGVL